MGKIFTAMAFVAVALVAGVLFLATDTTFQRQHMFSKAQPVALGSPSAPVNLEVRKYLRNPVISGRVWSWLGKQFYPPTVIRVGSLFYAAGKAGNSELWPYYSANGMLFVPRFPPGPLRLGTLDHESNG